jgi:hypothetical protein
MELLGVAFVLVLLAAALYAFDQVGFMFTDRKYEGSRMPSSSTTVDSNFVLDIDLEEDEETKESIEA